MTTREEAGGRQGTLWTPGEVPYSMYAVKNKYRTDCSGYVSGVLGLPGPGRSTVTLPALCTVIEPKNLRLGDLIGLMGPNTGGVNGHVMSFESHDNGGFWVWQQSGGRDGQYRSWISGVPMGYLAYRYDHFTEDQELTMDYVRDPSGSEYIIDGMDAQGRPVLYPISDPGLSTEWQKVLTARNIGTVLNPKLWGTRPASGGGGTLPPHIHLVPDSKTGPATPA
jgi:hypothetical protein